MAEPAALEFRSMGSPCRVVVDRGAEELAVAARDLVLSLERRWSRFLAGSEVSALNRCPGRICVVSNETYALVSHAVRAQEITAGRFNPLMLRQLEAHGYRRSWSQGTPAPSGRPTLPASRHPIVLYPGTNAVKLPDGSGFDPGGIGKGLAIDLAMELCIDGGAQTVAIELGGDLRVHGNPWYGSAWAIAIADPFSPDRDMASFTPTGGAVTTSTTQKRCWTSNGRRYHHLLDPLTGCPSETDVVSVTTCSTVAWWAEVAAKAALISGSAGAVELLDRLGTPGVLMTESGRVITTNPNRPAEVPA